MRTMLWCLLFLGGCATSAMSDAPVVRTLSVSQSPDSAYRHAMATMAQMGARVVFADATTRTLFAEVKGVVSLNVVVHETPGGTQVEVTGRLLPDKFVLGSFTEVDEYCTRYLQERTAHGR